MRYRPARRRQVPVSFLAFQDIITALAGTLLLIVLLTGLYKSTATPGGEVHAAGSAAEYSALTRLAGLKRAQLAAERKKLEQLRREFDQQARAAARLAEAEQLGNAIRKMEHIAGERQKMLEKLQSDLYKLQKSTPRSAEAVQMLDRLEKYRRLSAQWQHRQLEYSLQGIGNKENILLDCSRNRFLVLRQNRSPQDLGAAYNALDKVKNILIRHDPAATRLIIGVRPSAGTFAQALQKALKTQFPKLEIISEPLASETSGGLRL